MFRGLLRWILWDGLVDSDPVIPPIEDSTINVEYTENIKLNYE